jgi:hypothetical protein
MVKAILGKYWPSLVVALGLLLVCWLMYTWGARSEEKSWEIRWKQRDLEQAQDFSRKEAEFRKIEKDLRDDLANQLEANDARRAEMQRLQLDARNELDSLHGEVAALRTRLQRAGESAGSSSAVSSATRAAMVLTDLYTGCTAERQELAAAFDESRARGLAVERMYDKARGH